MLYIGIDVGKSGAIAVINEAGELRYEPTPVRDGEYDIGAMELILLDYSKGGQSFCMIERAQAMPGQGVVSMFEFGKGYGIWLTLLATCRVPYQVIHSRVWTKEMLAGMPGEKKERNIAAARRLFPTWQPKFKKELQYCDAMLLAEYGKRKKAGI